MIKITIVLLSFLYTLISTSAYAGWNTSISKNEMTGEKSAYANSARMISATEPMGFPYRDVKAWLGVGCNNKSEWTYIGFTHTPNLSNTKTEQGYNRITTRAKWDDEIKDTYLTQDWGSKSLHFSDSKGIIENIDKSGTMLIELNWHSQGVKYFKFPLNGSSIALKKIRKICSSGLK